MIFFDDQFNPHIAIIFCSLFACIFLRFLDLVWAKNLQESHPILRVTMVFCSQFSLEPIDASPSCCKSLKFPWYPQDVSLYPQYIYHRYTTLNHQTFDNLKSTKKLRVLRHFPPVIESPRSGHPRTQLRSGCRWISNVCRAMTSWRS